MTIKVLLAEDMHMVRGALVALLDLHPGIEVVAEVSHGDEILPAARKYGPDVAVLDIGLPGTDGLCAAELLRDEVPECRTLILTTVSKPGALRRAVSAGARGFLLKEAPPSQLADAICRVARGERAFDPELVMAAWDSAETPLTGRETEVLRLAAEGDEVAQIAGRLFLSAGTVRNYLTSSVVKLGARNRLDAVRIARDAGWV